MNRQIFSRTLSALILVLLFAWLGYAAGVRWNRIGQGSFMEMEAGRYERNFATQGDVAIYTLRLSLLCGAFVLVYESLAYGVSKLLFPPKGGKPE